MSLTPLNNNRRTLLLMSSILIALLLLVISEFSRAEVNDDLSVQSRLNNLFIGDLPEIRERRLLRVLVSYNRTNFFHSNKGERGIEHDLMVAYEKYLNRGPRKERYKTHVVFLTLPFDQLFDALLSGRGDIIAAGLTITAERQELVDFTKPYIKNIDEILVSGPNAAPVKRFEELSGKSVVVVANSSYVVHLQQINLALGGLGLDLMEIVQADSVLEAEDLLEMVNAGLFDYTIVDSHVAQLYSQAFSNLTLHTDFVIYHNAEIAWAINKNLPKFKSSLNSFIENHARPGRYLGNVVYRKYFENPFWIQHPLNFTALDKTPCLEYYIKKYSDFYDFNWYLIAAQAYKESKFDQSLVSNRGAYGVMQIKPSTAQSKYVQIPNIKTDLESNIHAGIRYLAHLRDQYYDKPEYSEEDQMNFALAAYNAGPGRIRQLQRLAKRENLDPYKWNYNVEVIARRLIGHETVNYVAVIQKTAIALQLATKLEQEKRLLKAEHYEELAGDENYDYFEESTKKTKPTITPRYRLKAPVKVPNSL